MTGVVAPSPIWQLSITLLLFPDDAAVVLKNTTPAVAEVLTPRIAEYCIRLLEAPFIKRIADPEVLVFCMVSSLAVPAPPGLPSIIQFLAPLRSMVAVVLAEEIELPVTPAAGLIVNNCALS